MEKIEIGYHPIITTLGIAHHKFIIYTRSDGSTFQIHGGGSNDYGFSPVDEIASSVSRTGADDSGFGFLNVTIFRRPVGEKPGKGTQRETVFEGRDLSAAFFKMAGMAQGIAEQKTPYKFLSNNSNTLVDDIVKWSGGRAPSLDAASSAPGSRPDTEFNPEFFSKLPPPLWGKNLYTRHFDVVSGLFDNDAVRKPVQGTSQNTNVPENDTRGVKRDRGDLQAIEPAEQPGADGFKPGRGGLFRTIQGTAVESDGFKPVQASLINKMPVKQVRQMDSLADVDDFDINGMAEEVFSSLTLDDWANDNDNYDSFEHLHPMRDGAT